MMPNYSNSTPTPRAAKRPMGPTRSESSLIPSSGKGVPVPVGNPDSKSQNQAKQLLMNNEQLNILQNDLRIVGLYVNNRHLEMLSSSQGNASYNSQVCKLDPLQCNRNGIAVYRITKLMYSESENTYEKLVSVYSALNSFGGLVTLILQSDGNVTHLYIATNTSGNSLIAGELFENNMKGQFPGCEIAKLSEKDKNILLDSCGMNGTTPTSRTVRSLSMIPSRREKEEKSNKEISVQGYEKFIDAMNGHKYTLVVLSQRISPDAMEDCIEGLETLYTSISPYAKEMVSYSESDSDTINYSISNSINNSVSNSISRTFGTSHTNSVSNGKSINTGRNYELFGKNYNESKGTSFGTSQSSGSSTGTSNSNSTSDSYGSSDSQSTGNTKGTNHSLTITRDNKAVQSLLNSIEEHLKRISSSQTFGMWSSACYIIADDVATATIGTSTLSAIFAGDSQAAPRAYHNQWDATNAQDRFNLLEYLQNLQHPVINLTMKPEVINGVKESSLSYQVQQITPAMMISGKEIPTLMGLPQKSVPGIVVDSMAEFGRNIPERWKSRVKRPILFGNIYHMGQIEESKTILDLDTFASHLFICGASGSGKSNTTYNLIQKLYDNKIPFLVIEPAKGEYKIEFAGLPDINIFTANESAYRLLQINPFEFNSGIHIREHLDNILQVISACWPLYGAMPGLLKRAFEQVYLDHGWDLEHSERIVLRGSRFPVFKELETTLEKIIDESPYSEQAKGDYKGALLNRISSLCNGFEGQIFGKSTGIPDKTLFNQNTIIDLSDIGSDETRSLLMGILIIKLRNYRKIVASFPNSDLQHVTILEEAHNILKRCSHDANIESGNIQGAAVSSLCRCIAEMRSAGEGFMIIDQSPTAVDETAIKNTAIKIVMRLPSKRDCEEIGAALSLNEKQLKELSRLDTGVAAIFHAGWTDTILAKMGNVWDKKYRVKSMPVLNVGTLTRVQGAIIQLIYKNIIENNVYSVLDDTRELLELLCKGSSAINPPLPNFKQQELLDAVQVFIETNDTYVKSNRTNELKRLFFDFAFEFLRLNSIMRIFPLSGVNTIMSLEPLSTKEIRKVLRWEDDIKKAIIRYLYMPEKSDPVRAYKWPLVASDSEYFNDIYCGILTRYSQRFKDDYRYANALAYLNSIDHFSENKGRSDNR